MPIQSYAMQLQAPGEALVKAQRRLPEPSNGQVRIRVEACGVCRTDLHVADGELPQAVYPVVPGHEVVGVVEAMAPGVHAPAVGERVGVPWLGWTCGSCKYCRGGRENLCDSARFTGCSHDGGYATHMLAAADYCVRLGTLTIEPALIAPLLCAGLIGWRALRAAGARRSLGLYGFGAAAHILTPIAILQGLRVHAFTRPGDTASQEFARSLGACWVGDSRQTAPEPLDAAIIFAPVGELVPAALGNVRKGGRVVCAGIHMSDIPAFPYRLLWQERQLVSVANLTRGDADSFFEIARQAEVCPHIQCYRLDKVNTAWDAQRAGQLNGAAVLIPD